mmetsp:Transcript_8125/g.16376  ORF Transcript_8125/g.16376 Transcript_8125/m.16376 type:complete len:302 (-) Transcript_8125:737-1642(-)
MIRRRRRIVVSPLVDGQVSVQKMAGEVLIPPVDLFDPKTMMNLLKTTFHDKHVNENRRVLDSAIKEAGFDSMESMATKIEELLERTQGNESNHHIEEDARGYRTSVQDFQEVAAKLGEELNLRQVRAVLEYKAAFEKNLAIYTEKIGTLTAEIIDDIDHSVSNDMLHIIATLFDTHRNKSTPKDPVELCLGIYDGLSSQPKSHHLITKPLKAVLARTGFELSEQELSLVIMRADRDKDARISHEELVAITQVLSHRHLRLRNEFLRMTRCYSREDYYGAGSRINFAAFEFSRSQFFFGRTR